MWGGAEGRTLWPRNIGDGLRHGTSVARLSQQDIAFWKVLSYQRLVLTWDNVQVVCESQSVLCPESKRECSCYKRISLVLAGNITLLGGQPFICIGD